MYYNEQRVKIRRWNYGAERKSFVSRLDRCTHRYAWQPLFSEVLKFIPCELCWYQRIFMYPQVFLLGMAFVRKEFNIARYTLMLSVIGGTISAYHYLIQK